MNSAERYVLQELASGRLTAAHIVGLTTAYQTANGLIADGCPGPETRASLSVPRGGDTNQLIITSGWLRGPHVNVVEAHPSWYGRTMTPTGIVAHYTATGAGTAGAMARRRSKRRLPIHRSASWHITVAQDGTIWQMVPLDRQAWHCRLAKDSLDTVHDTRGRAAAPNTCTIGVELEGHGRDFPAAQVTAAKQLWCALVAAYGISRDQAMLEHSRLDPSRRRDPGPVWMNRHAPEILAAAYPG